jgi:hypothetical protein
MGQSAVLWFVLLSALACGGNDAPPSSEDDHSAIGDSDRDGGVEPIGSDDVGQLRDAAPRRDAAAEADASDDAGTRADSGDPSSDGDPSCTPSASAEDGCDGSDDDCDGKLDEDYRPAPCDGRDSDLCKDGMWICTGQAGTRCDDDSASVLDVCNGQDDDCDPTSADGGDEAMFGRACDGPDGDRCLEGAFVCDGDALRCSDDSASELDECNGDDDDCDPATADGSSEPTLDEPCDGSDGDLCSEGAIACRAGQLGCSDETSTALDLCNGADDDCDPASIDGSEDPQVGMPCDGPDSDQCTEGVYLCNQVVSCSDATSSTIETCNGDDDDCDDATDENVDTNPSCASSATIIGSVDGDLGEEKLIVTGGGEAWKRLTIREAQATGSPLYLSASISLRSGAGTDYDLSVYCEGCGGKLAGESSELGSELDFVDVRVEDSSGDDSFTVAIEVLFYDADQCADWQLLIEGNTLVESAATCP